MIDEFMTELKNLLTKYELYIEAEMIQGLGIVTITEKDETRGDRKVLWSGDEITGEVK